MSSVFKRGLSYLGLVDDPDDEADDGPHPQAWDEPEHLPEVPVPIERDVVPAVTILTRHVEQAVEPEPAGQVHSVSPTVFADAQDVADHVKGGDPVLVNLQGAGRDLTRRMIDFCSGVTYALQGGMERVADGVFLITPADVAAPEIELPEIHAPVEDHQPVRRLA